MNWLRRRQAENYGASYGMQIETEERPNYVDDGLVAHSERVELCRRHWPEARSEDFTKEGRRKWRDSATLLLYREVGGCGPLLSPAVEDCDAFFVLNGKIHLLVRDDRPEPGQRTIIHGEIISRQVG